MRIIYLLILIVINVSCKQKNTETNIEVVKLNNSILSTNDIIKIDSIKTNIENDEKYAKIYYNNKIDTCSITFLGHPEGDLIITKNDSFEITQIIGGNFGNEITESFIYDYNLKKFKIIKEISISRDADEGILAPAIEVEYFNSYKPQYDITSLKEMLSNISKNYKNNNCKKDYNINLIAENIKILSITKENLAFFNDIGYYIQLCGDNYTAVYLLNEVLRKYPNRVVTYLNLADAYWELENDKKAKILYNKYISMMRQKGKENKIPKQVFDRVQ